jgi:defect-in-organelle-trafficking protein DotC
VSINRVSARQISQKRTQGGISACAMFAVCGALLLLTPASVYAQSSGGIGSFAAGKNQAEKDAEAAETLPPTLEELQNIEKENALAAQNTGLPFDIRRDAVIEAAISFGARGGLAARTFEIRQELDLRAPYLDKVYDFRQLLIPAPSGLQIEPPIINESLNAMIIEDGGQTAAVSDRMYNIVYNAKIVSTSRTWRTYLERQWGAVEPPPDILRPENDEERALWKENVAKGWEAGRLQADDIFQDDLNALQADFQGMINYRMLLAQGMISPPYALQVDRGVTGGGDEMRIGDRAVRITGTPELITGSEEWQPANR